MNKKKLFIIIIVFTILIISLIIILSIKPKYNKFVVNETYWNNIKDNKTEDEELILKEISFNDYKLIIDEKIIQYIIQ